MNLTVGLASVTLGLGMYLLAEGVLELILSFQRADVGAGLVAD